MRALDKTIIRPKKEEDLEASHNLKHAAAEPPGITQILRVRRHSYSHPSNARMFVELLQRRQHWCERWTTSSFVLKTKKTWRPFTIWKTLRSTLSARWAPARAGQSSSSGSQTLQTLLRDTWHVTCSGTGRAVSSW